MIHQKDSLGSWRWHCPVMLHSLDSSQSHSYYTYQLLMLLRRHFLPWIHYTWQAKQFKFCIIFIWYLLFVQKYSQFRVKVCTQYLKVKTDQPNKFNIAFSCVGDLFCLKTTTYFSITATSPRNVFKVSLTMKWPSTPITANTVLSSNTI